MSHTGIDKLAAPSADATSTSTNAPSSSTTADRPLGRGKYTYYGDGIIEYEYKPRKGKVQRVCGILGKDKRVSLIYSMVNRSAELKGKGNGNLETRTDDQETIDLVKKGFPDLAHIEPERFDFEIYNVRCNWVTVMGEAWNLLNRDPPLVWVIKLKDTAEEGEQRKPIPSSIPPV